MDWRNETFLHRILPIVIGGVVILVITFLLKKAISKSVKNNVNKYRSRKATTLLGYILITVVILFVYSDKLGNIGMALGLAGAGIAFALQEVIVSLAGWISLMVSGSVGVGHRVKIGDIKGDIIDIGLLTTTIMELGDWVDGDLFNGRIVTIANSFVFKEKVHNYSGEFPFLWDEITVPIRTESDFKLARKVFTEVLESVCGDYAKNSTSGWLNLSNKYRVEEAQVAPMVTLKFDENWIIFTLRYVVDFKKRRSTKDAIFTHLLEEIAKYDGIIMIATSTLEVTNVIERDGD